MVTIGNHQIYSKSSNVGKKKTQLGFTSENKDIQRVGDANRVSFKIV